LYSIEKNDPVAAIMMKWHILWNQLFYLPGKKSKSLSVALGSVSGLLEEMAKLSEKELKKLIRGGETNTIELKIGPPRATEMAERLCGMANAQGWMVILVRDADYEIAGVPAFLSSLTRLLYLCLTRAKVRLVYQWAFGAMKCSVGSPSCCFAPSFFVTWQRCYCSNL
jgi:hypothetical protein